MSFTWINAAAEGRASGYSYFNLYVNPANQQVVGWVCRSAAAGSGGGDYTLYYFLGDTGQGLASSTRGSARHAMDAVDGVVARGGVRVGLLTEAAGATGPQYALSIPKLTRQIEAHAALVAKRGW